MSINIKKIIKINELLIKHFGVPERQNPLPNPLDTLIATILSQNTNDNNSYKAFNNLKKTFNNWEEASNASKKEIEKLIKVAGLANSKSYAIKNLLNELKKRNDFKLNFLTKESYKNIIDELTKFKGIGVKTASCVLLFSLNRNICPVDTHLHRILNRIKLVNTKTPEKTFWELNKNFPDKIAHTFHTNLILLGREICKPIKPNCSICPIEKMCQFDKKNFITDKKETKKRILLLDNIGI
ncbi:MAG: endonuclease III [Melioribacteraceae bacterium]|nr:endonuclease III [Melioribacteraceae bacterium]